MTRYPSAIRYDEKRPSITFRVSKDEKELIEEMAMRSDKSVSELVRMALLGLAKDVNETRDVIYTQGYNHGYKNGKRIGHEEGVTEGTNKSAIWLTCYHCYKPVYIIPNSKEHKEIIEREKGRYRHLPECPPMNDFFLPLRIKTRSQQNGF